MESIADALQPLATRSTACRSIPISTGNPTPPSLDIYPGAPFQTGAGMGIGQSQVFFTIRARVSTADQESAMKLLLRLMDPNDAASSRRRLRTRPPSPRRRLRVPRVHRGLRNQRPSARLRMEGERFPMRTYKVNTLPASAATRRARSSRPSSMPFLEEQAVEQGQIEVVKTNEEEGGNWLRELALKDQRPRERDRPV